jgi:hypothetical protein
MPDAITVFPALGETGLPVVPESHQVPPLVPIVNKKAKLKESKQSRVNRQLQHAVSKLEKKNRKSHQFSIDIPLHPGLEAGTTWKIINATPDADQETWILVDVEHHLAGKQGSLTRLKFVHSVDGLTVTPAGLPPTDKATVGQPKAPAVPPDTKPAVGTYLSPGFDKPVPPT